MNIDKIIHKLQYLPEKVEILGNAIAVSQFFEAMAAGADLLKKLKEYQQLEADGRLVKLPCKVGDTVYVIHHQKVFKSKVMDICLNKQGEVCSKCEDEYRINIISNSDIGRTVFLTKAEAEAKLAELRGEK